MILIAKVVFGLSHVEGIMRIDLETAHFLNAAMKLDLEFEQEPGGVDMCKSIEKRYKEKEVTGAIMGMRNFFAFFNSYCNFTSYISIYIIFCCYFSKFYFLILIYCYFCFSLHCYFWLFCIFFAASTTAILSVVLLL